jgi:hypothetical protein
MTNRRHCRTLPDGRLAITHLACEDHAPDEVGLCDKAGFELGRSVLTPPKSEAGRAAVLILGEDWRQLVHHTDWKTWGEKMPLDACHCVDVSELPSDRTRRMEWVLRGQRIVIKG